VGVESERTGSQRLYVVAELRDPGMEDESLSRLVREIVRRVHHERGHRPARVLLVKPGTIPKTSSGKIQRSQLARMVARNELGDRVLFASGARRE
jgi:acyl-coenzyme A synthetase/AMP-(fatty) acid ligase